MQNFDLDPITLLLKIPHNDNGRAITTMQGKPV